LSDVKVKVKATAVGYFGILRVVGEVFEVPQSVAERGATWFDLVEPLPISKEVKAIK
jgi:hypothetical protein